MTDQRFEALCGEELRVAFTQIEYKIPPLVQRVDQALRKRREADEAEWSHKAGTPQTHARSERSTAAGRLYLAGVIDRDQSAWWEEIRLAWEMIEREVGIRVVSYEPRIDAARRPPTNILVERIQQIRIEWSYTRWREEIGDLGNPEVFESNRRGRNAQEIAPDVVRRAIIDMVPRDEISYSTAAIRLRIGKQRSLRILVRSLDLWGEIKEQADKEIDAAEMAAFHAGLI